MPDELHGKLAADLAITDWRSLGPHHDRGGLFLVDAALDLVDVAVAVARDDSAAVRGWLDGGLLRKPTDDEAGAWAAAPDQPFAFLIVQPFVLAAPRPGDLN